MTNATKPPPLKLPVKESQARALFKAMGLPPGAEGKLKRLTTRLNQLEADTRVTKDATLLQLRNDILEVLDNGGWIVVEPDDAGAQPQPVGSKQNARDARFDVPSPQGSGAKSRASLDDVADGIRDRLGKARKSLEHYKEAGALLRQAKKQLTHGEWTPWLKKNFDHVTPAMARKYMMLARHWGLIESEYGRNCDLGLEAALELVRTRGAAPTPGEEVRKRTQSGGVRVSISLPKDLRKRMHAVKGVDWSAVVVTAIEAELLKLTGKKRTD